MSTAIVRKISACIVLVALWRGAAPGAEPAPRGQAGQPTSTDEAAERNKIINSEQWRQARLAFDEWLSVQKVYDKQQVAQLKSRFKKKIAGMSAQELQSFLDQMQAKLEILLSPDAGDARDWLGQFVSAKVVFSEKELKQFDLVNMTAAQLEEALRSVERKRASRRQSSEAFNQMRQDQLQRSRELQRQREQSKAQARQAAQFSSQKSPYQSQYAPRRREPPPPRPKPTLYIGPWGGVGMTLPQ